VVCVARLDRVAAEVVVSSSEAAAGSAGAAAGSAGAAAASAGAAAGSSEAGEPGRAGWVNGAVLYKRSRRGLKGAVGVRVAEVPGNGIAVFV
jgi:hypothetical protein